MGLETELMKFVFFVQIYPSHSYLSRVCPYPTTFDVALFSTDMETLLVMGGIPLELKTDSLSREVCLVEADDRIPVADLTAIADVRIVFLGRPGALLLWIFLAI